jgi:hypothetical protein
MRRFLPKAYLAVQPWTRSCPETVSGLRVLRGVRVQDMFFDEVDARIVKAICANPRTSNVDLAKSVGLSAPNTLRRVNRLLPLLTFKVETKPQLNELLSHLERTLSQGESNEAQASIP